MNENTQTFTFYFWYKSDPTKKTWLPARKLLMELSDRILKMIKEKLDSAKKKRKLTIILDLYTA